MARTLIVGGTGFIGRHIAGRLAAQGHAVVAAGRAEVDIVQDDAARLRGKVAGFDVVINCAGLVHDVGINTMDAVHAEGAMRLFSACIAAEASRFIHISALGAAPQGETDFQRSKGAAEAFFLDADPNGTRIDWHALRPSVVIGRGGASTAWMLAAAALPILPRIGGADWRFQPIHVDDLTELVARLAAGAEAPRLIDVVGPEPLSVYELTRILRKWLGLPATRSLHVPDWLFKFMAEIGGRLTSGPLNPDVMRMLARGNVADPGPLTAALGRPPRDLSSALAQEPASESDRLAARLFFLGPALRWSLAFLWIGSGLLSLGVYPVEKSYEMLAALGLSGLLATLALYGGAALDLILGALLLRRWRPALVGWLQLASMAVFTLLAIGLPGEYWLHPFAPILKNVPIAAAILVMIAMETE
ncbi:NAD(P)H-binding protein [Methylocystis parvus]|uniref:NAD-dependent epimerase/dehydratase family protein n=1 Tax=Methylocystis parvus TaxID=134 RepID=A0A6B8MB03_9HYPH|nr:NAD(P)H-binding protein [Methylocystis parvus]QGM98453.1 NAD-dependent epimerase/dehydratase family protein [Methylocystis parvus]WBK01210.1 NAD-dependent epimerase/dehydratase family protein [Methylocystis parvus OBBP]